MGKIRFLTDEDFRSAIFDGVCRRLPDLDIVRTQDVGLRTFRDERILGFAAAESRIVLTHDVATMRRHANARVAAGLPMPGVLEISQNYPIGAAINEIVMIAECSPPEEWNNLVQRLPL